MKRTQFWSSAVMAHEGCVAVIFLLCALFALSSPALGHQTSESFLTLRHSRPDAHHVLEGHWSVGVWNLHRAVGLDTDGNGKITWGELKANTQLVNEYLNSQMRLSAGNAPSAQPCQVRFLESMQVEERDQAYFVIASFTAQCPITRRSQVLLESNLFFERDDSHRIVVGLQEPGGEITRVLTSSERSQLFPLATPGLSAQDRRSFVEGLLRLGAVFLR